MSNDGFKYLSQELNSDILDQVKQTEFYPHEYIRVFKSLKKDCQAKRSFIVY